MSAIFSALSHRRLVYRDQAVFTDPDLDRNTDPELENKGAEDSEPELDLDLRRDLDPDIDRRPTRLRCSLPRFIVVVQPLTGTCTRTGISTC